MAEQGIKKVRHRDNTLHYASGAGSAGWTDVDVWTPASGKSIRLVALYLYITDTLDLKVIDWDGSTENERWWFSPSAKETVKLEPASPIPLAADHILRVSVGGSAANTCKIVAIGYEV